MYYVVYIIFFIASILELNVKIYALQKYVIIFFGILILIFMAGLRGNVGTDYLEYLNFWIGLKPIQSFDPNYYFHFEIMYRKIFSFFKYFSNSEVFFVFLNAFLVFIPLFFAIKDNLERYYGLSLLIYYSIFFIPYALNGMRQAIAMSIFLYSIKYFNEKNTFAVLIISGIAGGFHSTGFLILPSYLIFTYFKKINLWFYPISLLLAFIIYKFNILSSFIFKQSFVNSEVYSEKYDESTSTVQLLTRLFLAIFYFYFCYINRDKNNKLIPIFNIYWFGLLLYVSLMQNNVFATRFNMFFRVLEVLLLPLIFICFRDKFNKNFIFIFVLIYYVFVFYVSTLMPDSIYIFYWE